MTQSIYKRHDVEWDCPKIRARGSFVKCMTTPVWISDHVTLITIPDSLSGSLLPRVRLSTGDLSEITDKILADSILWTSIPYGNFERACISLLLSGSFYGHLREEFSQKISSSCWHPLSISDKGDPTKFFFQTFLLLLESTYLGMGVHIFLWHFSLCSLGQRHGMEKNLAIKYCKEGKRKEWFPTRLAISVVFRWFNLARLPTCKSGCNQFCNLKLTKVKNYRNYKQSSKNISSVSDFLDICLLWFTALFLW